MKPEGELWIGVHFRWGDVSTDDPNKPNFRAGLKLSEFCQCLQTITQNWSKAKQRVFFFSENYTPDTADCPALKSVEKRSESAEWRTDLDIMSQSDLLIGGSSSFLVLGAFLCQQCSVVHSSYYKFRASQYEADSLLPSNVSPVYCRNLTCYQESIQSYLESKG